MKTIIIKGDVVRAYNGRTKFTEKVANRLTLKCEDLPFEEFDKVYATSGSKLTPSWVKDRTGYINLNSIYDIPVKTTNSREIAFTDWCNDFPTSGSKVSVKLTLKEGAIYPNAILVHEDGEISNPFEGM